MYIVIQINFNIHLSNTYKYIFVKSQLLNYNMNKILIIEDDYSFSNYLNSSLHKLGYEDIIICNSTIEARKHISENDISIILLDIFLFQENTIAFAHSISEENIPIIFMTQSEDIVIYNQLKDIQNSSFIVKPFHYFTIDRSIKILFKESTKTNLQKNVIKDGRKRFVMNYSDILWIKVEGNYCFIKTKEKQFVFKKSLAQIKELIPPNQFIQVHRNYLIPISEISKINLQENNLNIHDDFIPISRRYKSNIQNIFKDLF